MIVRWIDALIELDIEIYGWTYRWIDETNNPYGDKQVHRIRQRYIRRDNCRDDVLDRWRP